MKKSGIAATAAVWLVAACGGGGGGSSPPPPPPPNAAPTAVAGADVTTAISPAGVELDGTGSSDPDGDGLSYAWSILSEPANSQSNIVSAATSRPTLTAQAPGDYEIELKVTDPRGASGYDTVIVSLTNDPPVAAVDVPATMPAIGEEVLLDASGSSDPNGQSLSYKWTVKSSPPGSQIRPDFEGSPILAIQFDVEGEYTLSVEVSDGFESAVQDLPAINVSEFSIRTMTSPFRYVAAQPGGGVMVSAWNQTLAILDEAGAELGVVDLPETGRSVAVSPNGLLAAVGHATSVTFVDLETRTLLATHPVNADVGDALVSDEGYAYVFPGSGQWVSIISVDSATGTTRTSTGSSLRADTQVKMHPAGNKAYGADNGLSPSDVERYDFSAGGQSAVSYDSPYHGDYPFCGDLWIADDGERMLTRCGVIVRTTDDRATDMTYVMQLSGVMGSYALILDASYSAYTDSWYVLQDDGTGSSTAIEVFDGSTGNLVRTIDLPLSEGTTGNQLYAKYVRASQTSASVRILAQDHLTNPQAFYTVTSTVPMSNVFDRPPEIVLQKYSAGRTGEQVSLYAGASYDPDGMALTYDWTLVSEPEQSAVTPTGLNSEWLRFTPLVAGDYVFEMTASDGYWDSPPETVTVHVSAAGEPLVFRIEGDVVDAEYSKSQNMLVYLIDGEAAAHIVYLDTFLHRIIDLPRRAYRVGINPGGTHAAVSHPGMASYVQLISGGFSRAQEYGADWGDIALGPHGVAYVVPNRDQWVELHSIDFSGQSAPSQYGLYAGTQIRMHPNGDWVYGADRGLSPSDFEKWDVTTFPATRVGDSPYHGDYLVSGDIWIAEDGDDLLVASGRLFNSSDDPAVDMTYLDTLPDDVFIAWADHSTEQNRWAVAVASSTSTPSLGGTIAYYADSNFARTGLLDVAGIPSGGQIYPADPVRVFLTDDGSETLVLMDAGAMADPFALQISDTP